MPESSSWDAYMKSWQVPPIGDWRVWLIEGERVTGKSRGAAEYILGGVNEGRFRRLVFVTSRRTEVGHKFCTGPNGLPTLAERYGLASVPALRERRALVWPNGTRADLFAVEDGIDWRGLSYDAAWAEDIGDWGDAGDACWNGLVCATRNGRIVATQRQR